MIGPQRSGLLEVQLGYPARRLGAAIGIAVFDDFIEPGDQRDCDCHQNVPEPATATSFPPI
jgi:hypothetical protein